MEIKRARLLIAASLFLAVCALYWPTHRFDFVTFDDPDYVSENWIVQRGLTLHGLVWAFDGEHAANWHPLTWLSHMLDCQLFGARPGPHHLVNVALHALSSSLLFLIFFRWTKALWRSAIIAALFAMHPLRVESVAWISERKDVLSALFFMLTLWTYTRYVEGKSAVDASPEAKKKTDLSNLLLCLLVFCLGLLAKPTLITVPFVLLLVDYWPLRRADSLVSFRTLLREKIPFFAASAFATLMTVLAQSQGNAIRDVSLPARLANVPVAYFAYLKKTFWPGPYAALYEYPHSPRPIILVLAAVALLLVISIAVARWRDRRYFAVGWFWFIGMLVPMVGFVPIGENFIAERYSYLPSIGLIAMLTWAIADVTEKFLGRIARPCLVIISIISLGWCCTMAAQRLSFWQNSSSLWEQTLSIAPDCFTAHDNYGIYKGKNGDTAGAIVEFQHALKVRPESFMAWNNLGTVYLSQTNFAEAIQCFDRSLRDKPDYVVALNNIGDALRQARRYNDALPPLQKALELAPDNVTTHKILANLYDDRGQFADAIPHYEQALALRSDDAISQCNLAIDLTAVGKPAEAMPHFEAASHLNPSNARFHYFHGWAFSRADDFAGAIIEYGEAIKLNPDLFEAAGELSWLLATCPDARFRNGTDALRLAQRACESTQFKNPRYLSSLDAAYAEVGNFTEAIATAQKARSIFLSKGAQNLAQQCDQRLQSYQAGKPFRIPAPSTTQ